LIGSFSQLNVNYTPSNTTQLGVTWSSSNLNVATVDNGLVHGLSVGTSSIVVSSLINNNINNSIIFNVTQEIIELITLGITGSSNVDVNSSIQLDLIYTPSNTTQLGVTWSSSNTNIATVNNGLVNGLTAGSVIITATSLDNELITATYGLNINNQINSNLTFKLVGTTFYTDQWNDPWYKLYNSEYYTGSNPNGNTTPPYSINIYNNSDGTILDGYTKMTSSEKITNFGSAGEGWDTLNIFDPDVFIDTPYHNFASIADSKPGYVGLNVQNGTYAISILISVKNTDWGNINDLGSLTINNNSIVMPSIPICENTTWINCGNIVVNDGLLKFIFMNTPGYKFGYNGITIEKII
jgi:hypothetical protein